MAAVERETRQSILDAAAELIGERGYRATTTRAIAERAGVNEVTTFRHFGNKKGLLVGARRALGRDNGGVRCRRDPASEDTLGTLRVNSRQWRSATSRQAGAAAMRLAFDATSEPEVMEVMGAGPDSTSRGSPTTWPRDRRQVT